MVGTRGAGGLIGAGTPATAPAVGELRRSSCSVDPGQLLRLGAAHWLPGGLIQGGIHDTRFCYLGERRCENRAIEVAIPYQRSPVTLLIQVAGSDADGVPRMEFFLGMIVVCVIILGISWLADLVHDRSFALFFLLSLVASGLLAAAVHVAMNPPPGRSPVPGIHRTSSSGAAAEDAAEQPGDGTPDRLAPVA